MSHSVLIVGGGGREHALAWALASSPRVRQVFASPGNPGMARIPKVDLVPNESDLFALADLAQALRVDLVVVGPEAPLVDGLADILRGRGIAVFGPSAAAAQIEGSKAWSKAFMARHGIPTAEHRAFTESESALAYVRTRGPVVVKASGLAAGKGVFVCDDVAQAEAAVISLMQDGAHGSAGREVVIEERLEGAEASVMAFCDGTTAVLMPAVQDHKQLLDGDRGPNTGGMGAYTPVAEVDASTLEVIRQTVIEPALRGLADEDASFTGVLFAGLMLTSDGVQALEFNCRFGDPETQVVLPLLETDLYTVLRACTDGTLAQQPVRWRPLAAAVVVAASAGYPGSTRKGDVIAGLDGVDPKTRVFHAGTSRGEDRRLRTAGGRVLGVVGVHESLEVALDQAYAGLDTIRFAGKQCRRDIGRRRAALSYADAGVDIDAATAALKSVGKAIAGTHDARVLSGLTAFGGLFDIQTCTGEMTHPVLVASADGVGTKTRIAARLNRWSTIGEDLVNHSVNDILVQGATPLFFLDYVATSNLQPATVATVVEGVARACGALGIALLGGETAEMPGVYVEGELDLVGTIIGVVDKGDIIDGTRVRAGDAVLALPSSGLHTNGFSLARAALKGLDLAEHHGLDRPLSEALLAPHRCYLEQVTALRDAGIDIRALAHITGGGLIDNPPRVLPETVAMHLRDWTIPPLFQLIQRQGRIDESEMRRTFNLGLGLLIVVPETQAKEAQGLVSELQRIGDIRPRDGAAVVFGSPA